MAERDSLNHILCKSKQPFLRVESLKPTIPYAASTHYPTKTSSSEGSFTLLEITLGNTHEGPLFRVRIYLSLRW